MPSPDIPVDVLIQQLHGADWAARCDAARLLGQSGDPRAVDALLRILRRCETGTRYAFDRVAPIRLRSHAIFCSVKPPLVCRRAIARTVATLLDDLDKLVRVTAIWAARALQKAVSYRNQFGM